MGKIIEFEEIMESRKIAWESYAQDQTKNQIPAWIMLNGKSRERRTKSGVWLVKGYLIKNHELPPRTFWEKGGNGSNELVIYDSETGEKQIVMSYDITEDEELALFEIEVEASSSSATIKKSHRKILCCNTIKLIRRKCGVLGNLSGKID